MVALLAAKVCRREPLAVEIIQALERLVSRIRTHAARSFVDRAHVALDTQAVAARAAISSFAQNSTLSQIGRQPSHGRPKTERGDARHSAVPASSASTSLR